jgi:hypothetical protein
VVAVSSRRDARARSNVAEAAMAMSTPKSSPPADTASVAATDDTLPESVTGANVGARRDTSDMTRFAVDADVALRLIAGGVSVTPEHSLVGPAVLRSHALAKLYAQVREGTLDERTGRARLEQVASMKIRLLGDRVSRATAWRIAVEQGWDDPVRAEYLAVAVLQADALITEDPTLAAAARARGVPLAGVDDVVAARASEGD